MPRFRLVAALAICAFGFSVTAPAEEPSPEGLEFFEKKIRPVLAAHCYECHSAQALTAKTLKGGLRLDARDAMLKGGDSGEAIVPGKPDESLLISSLKYDSFEMPPAGKLPANVIADFEQWIRIGAPDPREDTVAEAEQPGIDWAAAKDFWSFRPVEKPAPPEVADGGDLTNPIDRFVRARLNAAGLKSVRPATKRDWLRRVTLDLTGLPPTPEELANFLADNSDTAYETVVDRLLESPRYGERWARHWLDVARFAEDQAHTFAVKPKTNAFRYRDWVIRAFNDDMPYDRFVRLQIAGDHEDASAGDAFTRLAGLGFLGLGAEYYKNTAKEQAIADELDDRIDTLTRGFLGLTVSCARCHDHKYDPIPTRDYYALAGIFNGSRLTEAPLASADVVRAYNEGQKRVKGVENEIRERLREIGAAAARNEAAKTADYITTAWRMDQVRRAGGKVNVAEIAKETGSSPYFLGRWSGYLEAKNKGKTVAELGPLFDVRAEGITKETKPGDVTVPESVTKIATEFAARLQPILALESDAKKLEKPDRDLLKAIRQDKRGPFFANEAEAEKHLLAEDTKADIAARRKTLEEVKQTVPAKYPSAHVLSGGGQTMPVYIRGNPKTKGELAPKGFLTVLGEDVPEPVAVAQPKPETASSDEPLFASKRIDTKTPGHAVDIDVALNGARELHLVVTDGGDGISCDWVDWGEPRLVADDGSETKLTDLKWTEARSDWQQVRVGVNAAGGALKIGGQPVKYGFGTHAKSLISFRLPEGKTFTRFRARAGLDDGGANQGPAASVQFFVYARRPAMFGADPTVADARPTAKSDYGRADLAAAITDPANPLTARVFVNRVWQHHFGRGLVGTSSNFGELGERPTHPELLDWLAAEFVESGWSTKSLHRRIVLSATYRLSSDADPAALERDPENRFLWRANRRRLDVEAWRDSLLFVSGRLDETMGGPTTNVGDPNNRRRTVYAKISRHNLDGLLRLFDFPDANVTAAGRTETTVPQQQLFVLNGEFFVNQAKAFASRLQSAAETDDARIRTAYGLAYGRSPSEAELQLGLDFLATVAESNEGNALTPWQQYAQALLAANEFLYVD